ncbi:hypothetical protein TWF225_008596 [Orbilia oligospora]|uniref:Uncharacterized protein n=1 Tax=Orbilia oligospora TaxID=2813651 RepID=A0A7C8PDP0_ORBOL|nr:hypothetical protein TWF751_010486 [Orbilia oligospora]KAF3176947.1 hypothetical protein TWF225_008596 [Orbilia oligospora]KAF3239607.1 hypothetical protein TWF128_011714 [Orbilia oligospora]KAF3255434.1 hypothetical protein TWF217_006605 [Orbilia oligospora]KAF3295738.1 hypothetical protein TWF132_001060 [Orbilia oligospora]
MEGRTVVSENYARKKSKRQRSYYSIDNDKKSALRMAIDTSDEEVIRLALTKHPYINALSSSIMAGLNMIMNAVDEILAPPSIQQPDAMTIDESPFYCSTEQS